MSSSLLSLLQLSDPALPIGGFSHSAGLETYVQKGIVHDAVSAGRFIRGMMENLLHNDAAFVSLAFEAARLNDEQAIFELDNFCSAAKLPMEMRQASQKLGMRLLKIFEPLCPSDIAVRYRAAIEEKLAAGHYAIAFGLLAFALGIGKQEALTGFYYNAAAGFVTNSVKLVPLGQQDGQRLLFSLHPLITSLVARTMEPDQELLGLSYPAFDIRSMQHETLYSRLYMS